MYPVFLTGQETNEQRSPEQEQEQKIDTSLFDALKLRSIGPAFMSGRIGDIAVDQQNPNTWYIAVASGNVFKTSNARTLFQHWKF